MKWYLLSFPQTIKELKSNALLGLSEEEVKKRWARFGFNKIVEKKENQKLKNFLRQFKSPLIYILIIAGSISLFLRHYTDSVVIFSAVFIQVALGFIQENKASNILDKLKSSVKIKTIILRAGQKREIEQSALVPGDIVFLKPGDKVPADGRLLEANELKINESILTGEWLAVKKDNKALKKENPLSDRKNMVYMGTTVESGQGKFIVTSTAVQTEIGKIAKHLSKFKEQTPLQRKIAQLSKFISFSLLAIISLIFLEGVLKGRNFLEIFNISVATAVASIPEGLVIASTVILVLGMQKILKKQGLVKRLTSAETLGSASIVCTDKTGTLTQGKMEVAYLLADKEMLSRDGLSASSQSYLQKISLSHLLTLKIALLSTSAFKEGSQNVLKKWILHGTPIEKALLQAGLSAGLDKTKLEKEQPFIKELLFTPENKFSAKLRKASSREIFLYLTGAPEVLLKKSSFIFINNKIKKISAPERKALFFKLAKLSKQGFIILAVAYKKIKFSDIFKDNTESVKDLVKLSKRLIFTGLIVLHDSIRKKALSAVRLCRAAGIRPIIVTGDHKLTAQRTAREIGINIQADNILEGLELERMREKKFEKRIEKIKLYARLDPLQKVRIVQAWQKRGEVVAMTGDGVNDAPALKKADIGVALGSGTEIAKESADLVLLNDDFHVIVESIREGRAIIDKIRKVITYLLSDSFTEILLIGTAVILGLPLPVLPLQILWLNLIEDGLPNVALAFEKREDDLMQRKPEKNLSLLNTEMKVLIFAIGLITDLLLLGLFLFLIKYSSYSITHIRSIVFTALSLDSLLFIFSCKSLRHNIWQINPFSNKFLNLAWLLSTIMMLAALYFAPLRNVLELYPLSLSDWQIILGLSILDVGLIEFTKWLFIQKDKKTTRKFLHLSCKKNMI